MILASRLALTALAVALAATCASAQVITYDFCMTGAEENPPVNTPGTGRATMTIDTGAMTYDVNGTYQGLLGDATAAHIHGPAPIGTNAGVMFGLTPSGSTSGTVTGSGSLSAGQMNNILNGMAYLNVHSTAFGGGELRGQVDNLVGSNYCVGSPNSVGLGASISASGCDVIAENSFSLSAGGLPATVPGLFFFGPNQIDAPFGDGRRCVGGTTIRIQPVVFASGGQVTKAVDLNAAPVVGNIAPGMTTNFQFWYRDPMGPGGNGFNTTDGLAVTWN